MNQIMHVCDAVPSTALSHLRMLKNPKGIKDNTSKRPQMSWPIKYFCALLQNPPEKLVPPWLCPRQPHCTFAAACGRWGLNWAQSKSQKTAHGIPLRGTPQTGHFISQRSSPSPCLYRGRERAAPSQQEILLAASCAPCQTPPANGTWALESCIKRGHGK